MRGHGGQGAIVLSGARALKQQKQAAVAANGGDKLYERYFRGLGIEMRQALPPAT